MIDMDMDLDELRRNKMESALILYAEGRSLKEIALLLYDDESQASRNRVTALLSKIRKKMKSCSKEKSQPQPQPSGSQPQPQPKLREEQEHNTDEIVHVKKELESTLGAKEPETVEKGKSSDTVLNWLDENMLAKQLADECYEAARNLREKRDYQNTFRFMELVTRFLRLSQTARKEYDLEEARKELAELHQKMKEKRNGIL